jgi:hypothetical protein
MRNLEKISNIMMKRMTEKGRHKRQPRHQLLIREAGRQQLRFVEISICLILSVRWMYLNSSKRHNRKVLNYQWQGLKLWMISSLLIQHLSQFNHKNLHKSQSEEIPSLILMPLLYLLQVRAA